ncbi:MAG TPA: hypothetical protein DDZ96_03510 [Porphyromonadaceae bacterium]|jgi:hypothetical protein|nr:hypothetical protein [Porphyromonadaceae bacterium]HBL32873.1 hypothetical protein [Porphyromonadaceae bacterium]HBX19532.1 hypothetical protein [Porphyromonadaceae bacterium]HCM20698.1 hypothetical protein [Porphyromonadaceae bacterium]
MKKDYLKYRVCLVCIVWLLYTSGIFAQNKKNFDFQLAGSIGAVGLFIGSPTTSGLIASISPEFIFPKLKSSIGFRLGYGFVTKSQKQSSWGEENEAYTTFYRVTMFTYGGVYQFIHPFFYSENSNWIFDNEFSWANLKADVYTEDYTSRLKGYFFYTGRIGIEFNTSDDYFVKVMPWVGFSTLKLRPVLNKDVATFGWEEAPFTIGLTLKIL